MEFDQWKQDPRLQQMDPAKLDFITEFAGRIQSMPRTQILPAFLTLNMEAAKRGIRFSDSETELFVSVLSTNLSQADQKKLESLRILAQKLAARSS